VWRGESGLRVSREEKETSERAEETSRADSVARGPSEGTAGRTGRFPRPPARFINSIPEIEKIPYYVLLPYGRGGEEVTSGAQELQRRPRNSPSEKGAVRIRRSCSTHRVRKDPYRVAVLFWTEERTMDVDRVEKTHRHRWFLEDHRILAPARMLGRCRANARGSRPRRLETEKKSNPENSRVNLTNTPGRQARGRPPNSTKSRMMSGSEVRGGFRETLGQGNSRAG